MRECDNSKIHTSSNLLFSIRLLIILDTLLLVPSLHCNTSLQFTTLHQTTLHFLSFTLHYPLIWLNPSTFPIILFHLTSLNCNTSLHFTTLRKNIPNTPQLGRNFQNSWSFSQCLVSFVIHSCDEYNTNVFTCCECIIFGAQSFIFQFAIQKVKDQDI